MMELLFPMLVAAVVGLTLWGGVRFFMDPERKERRRLNQRLSTENRLGPDSISPEFRPIVMQTQVVGLPPGLAKHPAIQALNRKLLQAYPNQTLGRFLMFAVAGGFVGLVAGFMLLESMFMPLIIGAAGFYLPFIVLNRKRSKRQRLMAEQLPEALDFLSRVLKAGHSFSTGLQMMADELPMPLAGEFRRCYDQHSLGQALEDSLRDTSTRVESSDFAFFVTALLIQRQTGGDLSEVLKNISGMIRSRVRLAQQVKAKTAEGRFTGYILVAFPAVMFLLCYMQNPGYTGKLLQGTGLYFLGTALGLQTLGLWAIKKITTIKV